MTDDEKKAPLTDEEWLAAYLLRFGTATINSANVQEGEAQFLQDMGHALKKEGSMHNAWWVIVRTYRHSIGLPGYKKGGENYRLGWSKNT